MTCSVGVCQCQGIKQPMVPLKTITDGPLEGSPLSTQRGRVFFLYRPRDAPSLARALVRGQPAICRQGSLVRDFLHVADVARALVLVLESEWRGPVNIGSGQGVALSMPPTPDAPARVIADVGALRSLGFAPAIPLEEGLRRTLEWWRAEAARSG